MREALSEFAATRHLAALLDAIAAVRAVRLYAGLHDAVLGRPGGRTGIGLLHPLAGAPRLIAVRLGRTGHLARQIVSVLLRIRPCAHEEEREAEDACHIRSERAYGGAARSSGFRHR